MRKKIIFILLCLIMLGTIAYFYINRIFLPQHVKHVVEQRLAEATHRTALIEKIRFTFTKGITLENVMLRDSNDNQIFCQIDQVHLNPLIAPFLKNQTIVIPTITFQKPVIRVTQYTDGSFNFSDIKSAKPSDASMNQRIFVRRVKINGGSVDFLTHKTHQDFSERFRNINASLALSLDRHIDYRIEAEIPEQQSRIGLSGKYQPGADHMTTRIELSRINILKYLPHLYSSSRWTMSSGQLTNADVILTVNGASYQITGQAFAENTRLHLTNGQTLQSDMRMLNSTVTIRDGRTEINGELRMPNALLEVSTTQTIRGDLQAQIDESHWSNSEWTIKGNMNLNNASTDISGQSLARAHIASHDMTLTSTGDKFFGHANLNLRDAQIQLSDKRHFSGNLATKNTSLQYENKNWQIKSQIDFKKHQLKWDNYTLAADKAHTTGFSYRSLEDKLEIGLPLELNSAVVTRAQGGKFQGSPDINLRLSRPMETDSPWTVNGQVVLSNGLIMGLPQIQTASNLKGTIDVSNDQLSTDELTFNTENTNIGLSGNVSLRAAAPSEIRLETASIEIERIRKFLPKTLKRYPFQLNGRTGLSLLYTGDLNDLSAGSITVNANLKEVDLNSEKFPHPVTKINGHINYRSNKVIWNHLRGRYRDTPFELNGELNDFSRPRITTTASGQNFDVVSEIELFHNIIRLPILDVKYNNSTFSGDADIYLYESVPPDFQIKGKSNVTLSDAVTLLPKWHDRLFAMNPRGQLNGDVFFKGKTDDWLNWSLSFEGRSESLTIYNHNLSNIKLKYLQRDGNISKFDVTAETYGGKMNFASSANLESRDTPFEADLGLFRINLADVVAKQNLKAKNLSGALTFNLDIGGYLKDKSSWNGAGNFEIRDGYIWRLKILEGLSSFLLIPEFKNTIYTEASGQFSIGEQKIRSNDLILESQTMKLIGQGWIGFDRTIYFDVTPKLSEIAMIESDSMKKWTSAFLSSNIKLVRVTGSLDTPTYKAHAASPLKILKGTTGVIKEGIGGILGELF